MGEHRLQLKGIGLPVISKALGHTNTETTLVYIEGIRTKGWRRPTVNCWKESGHKQPVKERTEPEMEILTCRLLRRGVSCFRKCLQRKDFYSILTSIGTDILQALSAQMFALPTSLPAKTSFPILTFTRQKSLPYYDTTLAISSFFKRR